SAVGRRVGAGEWGKLSDCAAGGGGGVGVRRRPAVDLVAPHPCGDLRRAGTRRRRPGAYQQAPVGQAAGAGGDRGGGLAQRGCRRPVGSVGSVGGGWYVAAVTVDHDQQCGAGGGPRNGTSIAGGLTMAGSPTAGSDDLADYAAGMLSGRLSRLRALAEDDLPVLGEWWNDPAVMVLQQPRVL